MNWRILIASLGVGALIISGVALASTRETVPQIERIELPSPTPSVSEAAKKDNDRDGDDSHADDQDDDAVAEDAD